MLKKPFTTNILALLVILVAYLVDRNFGDPETRHMYYIICAATILLRWVFGPIVIVVIALMITCNLLACVVALGHYKILVYAFDKPGISYHIYVDMISSVVLSLLAWSWAYVIFKPTTTITKYNQIVKLDKTRTN